MRSTAASTSWDGATSLAGFQVSTTGRFWVSTEEQQQRAIACVAHLKRGYGRPARGLAHDDVVAGFIQSHPVDFFRRRGEQRDDSERSVDERSAEFDRLQDFLDRFDISDGRHPTHLHWYWSEAMASGRSAIHH